MVPVAHDDLIPALLEGRGDIVAAGTLLTEWRREQVDRFGGGGSSRTAGRRIPVGSRLGAARPRSGCHTFGGKSRGVREGVRCRNRRSAVSVAAVAYLTDLSAGGLRSSATVNAAQRPKAAGARRLGTDPPNGLATAEWQHARTNPGRPSASVLGPEACRVRGIEGSRNPNSASAEPDCCIQKGFYWDEAILYPASTHWKDASASLFWNGPVVRITPGLENSLSEVRR
jgi:hypothetical protein